ncbi:hypothetical protein [Thermosulfuriphilus sp.]
MKRWFLVFLVGMLALGSLVWASGVKSFPPDGQYSWSPANAPQGGETSIKGQVLEITPPVAKVQTDQGQSYNVRLGPVWFWRKNNYRLNVGDQVEIVGYRQGNLIFPQTIKVGDQEIRLRDARGLPLWRHGGWGPCRCGHGPCQSSAN